MAMSLAILGGISNAIRRTTGYRFLQVGTRVHSSIGEGANVRDREPDPFGLGDSEGDLSSVVQGLYSHSSNNGNQRQEGSPDQNEVAIQIQDDRTVMYRTWLDDTRTQRREAKLAQGGELVHSAAFGLIRLDQENFPRSQEEEEEDEAQVILNQRETRDYNHSENDDRIVGNSTMRRRNQSYASTRQSATGNPSSGVSPTNGKVDAILEKSSPVIDASEPTPSIYQMQALNDLTHAEMWELLKDHVGFQNDFLVAINKPYGLPMHSPSRECRHTVLDFLDELTTYCQSSEKVYPLHRLDKDTTGVLLFAKTQIAATIIKQKFASREIRKKYLAVTKNCPPMRHGTIDIPIAEGKVGGSGTYRSVLKPNLRKYQINNSQEGAKPSVSHFQVLRSAEGCSFMEIKPETGVKHQIRIHLGMALGCPVLGDHKYSHREKLAPQRLSTAVLNRLNMKQSKVRHLPLHLHCSTIEFDMPESFSKNQEPVYIHSRPPKYFMHTLRKLWLSKG